MSNPSSLDLHHLVYSIYEMGMNTIYVQVQQYKIYGFDCIHYLIRTSYFIVIFTYMSVLIYMEG